MMLERWVQRALRKLTAAQREHFALDPLRSLGDDHRFTVRAVEHLASRRDDGGGCDGTSFLEDNVILYAPSPNSKRQNFTLAHELGHWLVEQDSATLDWLADQDEPRALIESLCDAIAQRLLLPEDLIDHVVGRPIRAPDVVALFEQSAASLPVCAIAAAARLPQLGAVIVIDRRTMEVTSSSVHPHPEHGWPSIYPWPGEELPEGHSLRSIGSGETITRRSFWRNRWGKRADYYVDAIASDRAICAVLSDTDLWGVDTMPVLMDHDYVERPENAFQCCGEWRTVRGFPCPKCGRGYCPVCGNCRCTTVSSSEGQCRNCNTITPAHLLADGLCEICA